MVMAFMRLKFGCLRHKNIEWVFQSVNLYFSGYLRVLLVRLLESYSFPLPPNKNFRAPSVLPLVCARLQHFRPLSPTLLYDQQWSYPPNHIL